MIIKHRGSLGFLLAASLIPAHLLAGGYKVPENSINSTALSAAYVANAHGADAAYFNPAAMVYNDEGGSFEIDLTYIHLSAINYSDNDAIPPYADDSSDVERFLVPTFHYVSPKIGNARFGLSVVTPAGLTKRWDGTGKASTQQFTLKTVEINPSIAYEFNDQFSAAIGARVLYSDGVVKSKTSTGAIARDLAGDSYDIGYNLALHFKPTDQLDLALTYRSKIDMTVEGEADLVHPVASYYGVDAEVEVPLPAALNLAAAYTFNEDRTTVELVYERTYWSAYKELDFDYDTAISAIDPDGAGPIPSAFAAFDAARPKNWKDTDTYRIGVTHKLNNQWTLMAGYAYDKSPAPESTVGFELPDSDAHIYSVGARYQYSDDINVGFGLLYDKKETLKITRGNSAFDTTDNAEFEDASAILLTVGMQYKF